MTFWQLTIDCAAPARLVAFWAVALGYTPTPPAEPDTTWSRHYRQRLEGRDAFDNRLFDPEGLRPPIWFQEVPEGKATKNRLHIDVYPTGRDSGLTLDQRVSLVDAKVDQLVALGAQIVHRVKETDPDDPYYFVVMQDPEANEFCVS